MASPTYGSMYGSFYFSTVMSTAFYGVACMQTFFYYIHYQRDPLRTKIFVAAVWAFNTVHTALNIADTYKYIIGGLADPFSLSRGIPELVLQVPFTTMVAVTTQGFFVYRIYVFNGKNMIVPIIYVPPAAYQLVSAFIYVAKALYSANGIQAVELSVLNDQFFKSLATSSLAVAAVIDVSIAVFLTYLLLRKRCAAACTSTIHILQRLTVFAVNAGIWTATFALLSLILLHAFPMDMIYMAFVFPICSIYCNTLLANLNARLYIRGEVVPQEVDVDLFGATPRRLTGTYGPNHSRAVSFHMEENSDGHGGLKTLSVDGIQPTTMESAHV